MESRYFSKKIAQWYGQHKRDLPWRNTKDPYKIWLSEVILQQTRVNQGLAYYLKLVETFPTVESLAVASEQQVLRLWQGLGYYSRARNMHKCAKLVVSDFRSQFPSCYDELKKLPGIGDYTAAAIASIAFGEQVAVVDGNVYRVLSRLFGIEVATNTPQGKKIFSELANSLVPKVDPGEFNQGVMEFGALYCTPQNPSCSECIFQRSCIAFKGNLQQLLPVKIKVKKVRKRYFNYFVLQVGKSVIMKKRNEKDIWQGLYDFYLVETGRSCNPNQFLTRDKTLKRLVNPKTIPTVSGVYKQVLSHQQIFSRFVQINISRKKADDLGLTLYSTKKLEQLPKPVLINRFLKDYKFL